jgi:hypothetical protein
MTPGPSASPATRRGRASEDAVPMEKPIGGEVDRWRALGARSERLPRTRDGGCGDTRQSTIGCAVSTALSRMRTYIRSPASPVPRARGRSQALASPARRAAAALADLVPAMDDFHQSRDGPGHQPAKSCGSRPQQHRFSAPGLAVAIRPQQQTRLGSAAEMLRDLDPEAPSSASTGTTATPAVWRTRQSDYGLAREVPREFSRVRWREAPFIRACRSSRRGT